MLNFDFDDKTMKDIELDSQIVRKMTEKDKVCFMKKWKDIQLNQIEYAGSSMKIF